jgi:ABC-type transport system involved in cytochrome bd biosynthesis fused ATPase/permease subunit
MRGIYSGLCPEHDTTSEVIAMKLLKSFGVALLAMGGVGLLIISIAWLVHFFGPETVLFTMCFGIVWLCTHVILDLKELSK